MEYRSIKLPVPSKVPACYFKESIPKSMVLPHEWLRQDSPNLPFLRDWSKEWFVDDFVVVLSLLLFKQRQTQNSTFSVVLCVFREAIHVVEEGTKHSRWKRMSLRHRLYKFSKESWRKALVGDVILTITVSFFYTVYHYITSTISISLVESSVKSLAIELQWPKGISFKKNEQRATEGFLNRKLWSCICYPIGFPVNRISFWQCGRYTFPAGGAK